MSILTVEDLALESADGPVVRGASFSVEAGETLVLLGESGSGKSLSALSALRLLPKGVRIAAGRIALAGREVFALTEAEMRGLRGRAASMIFQEPSLALNPTLTIGRQVGEAFAGLGRGERRRRAADLLGQVGIPDAAERLDDYPFQFSGGMRQRAMIAMALAADPELLIADEPTSALDVTVQAQILALLRRLQRERGMAILLITHDMGVAAQNADRIAVMRDGEVVERAGRDEFFRGPRHEYSRRLLSALPRPRPASARREGGGDALAVDGLKVHFPVRRGVLRRVSGHIRAVDGVSLRVRQGTTLAVVGESGSGKTTLARAALRLAPVTEGKVFLAGSDITALSQRRMRPHRRRIQIVFQDPYGSLNPHLRVGDLIAEGMRALGVGADEAARRARTGELLERVGLEARMAERFPHEFSGGQRQRIAIARALAVEPATLVCDEPTSALDLSVQAQVLALLAEIQEASGVAYLFITHNIGVVEAIADGVAVMAGGKLVESGPARAVLDAPREERTRALLAAVPQIPSATAAAG